ncbi:MAG TPA: hypothetical protein VN924_00345 [Bryobacteraceae bacterium]|jgi:hypothetical protein|nr:hypothetical protein [Bryobacteraceae bacterium]
MNEPEAAVWMGRLAALSRDGGALPNPALIWWKARLFEKQAAQARATRPIAIAQWVSLAVAAVTTIVLCMANWRSIQDLLAPAGLALWVAGAACVILMGMALRFVFSD